MSQQPGEGERAGEQPTGEVPVAAAETVSEEGPEEVPIAENEEEVEFVQARLSVMTGFSFLRAVRRLNLRRNLIKDIDGLATLTTLQELELYDNQISDISGLETLVNLQILDLSYNRVRKITGLAALTSLRKLFLVHNKIEKIEGLEALTRLELLELGDNKIRKMEGLSTCTRLQRLFLGKNKVRAIEGLERVSGLVQLSLQANRITVLEHLEHLAPSLTELYVSENGLKEIGAGLLCLTNLIVLDLATNFITTIRGVTSLNKLTDFWFNNNLVADWRELEQLQGLATLRTLYFHGNPIERKDLVPGGEVNPDYRRKMLLLFPNITRLDAIPCRLPL